MEINRFCLSLSVLLICTLFVQQAVCVQEEKHPLEPVFHQMRIHGFEILKNERDYANFMYREGFNLAIHFQPECTYCKQFAKEFTGMQTRINDLTGAKIRIGVLVCDPRDPELLQFCETLPFEGFPHIAFYWLGSESEYTGENTQVDIANWVSTVITPRYRQIEGLLELHEEQTSFKKAKDGTQEFLLIGKLDREPTTVAFIKTAQFWPKAADHRFIHADSKKIRDKYKMKMDETKIVIWKNVRGQMVGIHNGGFDDWTDATKLVEESFKIMYEPVNLVHIKQILSDPGFKLVIFFTESSQSQAYKAYEKFGKSNMNKGYSFVYSLWSDRQNPADSIIRRLLGLESKNNTLAIVEKNPKLALEEANLENSEESSPDFNKKDYGSAMIKYRYTDPIDLEESAVADDEDAKAMVEDFEDWLSRHQRGKLRTFTKTDSTDVESYRGKPVQYVKVNHMDEFTTEQYAGQVIVLLVYGPVSECGADCEHALNWMDELAKSPVFEGVLFLKTNMYRNEIDDFFVQCPKFTMLVPQDPLDESNFNKLDAFGEDLQYLEDLQELANTVLLEWETHKGWAFNAKPDTRRVWDKVVKNFSTTKALVKEGAGEIDL